MDLRKNQFFLRACLRQATIWAALVLALHAQDASTISPFPRGEAMAEAFTVFSEDLEAIHYNPALSMTGRPHAGSFSFSSWVEGTTLLALGWRSMIKPNLSVGLLTTLFVADGIENTSGGSAPFVLNNLGIWVPSAGLAGSFVEFNLTGNVSSVLHLGRLILPVGANLKIGRYAFNGEGKTRLSTDLGSALYIHESFGLPTAVPNPLVRGLIPSRFAMTLKGFGAEVGSAPDLATEFNNLEFTAALGWNHWHSAMFQANPKVNARIDSEIDVSTRRGFSWGIMNRFAFGDVRPELYLGLNLNGDEVRPSGGLQVSFKIHSVSYHLTYAAHGLAGLGVAHHFAVGAQLEADVFQPKETPVRSTGGRGPADLITEVRLLVQSGRFDQARPLLASLVKKYPENPDVLELKAWFEGQVRNAKP